ncbi:divergent polysaccharide deacetylase family protein [uncultured Celeribacter sp.]|uniref:divergent polysaccharide deacetylase family protein n=1 Tax=uncultured Celeribacter sp. TaxID=1303376 RepID=UPI002AA65B93|nr:divergent polysaccharide deacetylase family protein [uncultured Celeribacter sp.]
MGRGILTGLIWGTIVGFGILTVANEVVAPVTVTSSAPVERTPEPTAPEMTQPEAPEGEEGPAVTSESPAAEPDRSGAQPEVAMPDAEADATPEAATEAATAPEIETPTGPQTPETDEALDAIETPETSPVLAPPQAMAPEASGADNLPVTEEALPGTAMPEGVDETPAAPQMPRQIEMDSERTPDLDAEISTGDGTKTMQPAPAEDDEALPGQKVGSFTDRQDDRVSSRLPSISATPDAEAPVVMADDLPALLAYSADFNQTPSGPVMSVILVDIAQLDPEDAVLSNLPFPVTFAVDALATRAGERAMAYRDKGLEVLSMVSLPQGATPQDAAVTLSQAADLVPVSIGFLDVPSGTFQSSRQVAAQVVATAQESGRGLVTFPRGLNALEQEAQRVKAPAGLVFRDFDGRSQDVEAMKRFLDQAAFQAGTGKTVILLGRSKPDTIQALAEWSLGNRAATVTMVPLSYLLSRSQL